MIISIKLFILGIIIAYSISSLEVLELEKLPEDPIDYIVYTASFTGPFVKLLYYSLLIVVLPFVAIPQFKTKLPKKSHYVYTFLSGITFGFSVVGIYTVIITMNG